ncbi:glycogen synthase [Methanococcoides methylutens]|uniref:Glycogen synthase n=1 Tax=Methanococcoides methylutens TaxID=2226 RepID=A0A099T3V4_METMT|nr:glycogen synthase [Methanococcoides methylutens]KGK99762.1 glycogen synthase [Methanococcoides methylutens]
MGKKWLIIAGEEAGPRSNKMGGIWDVIDAEATTLASLIDSKEIKDESMPKIIVVGPYYGHSGADWNKGLNRITDISELEEFRNDEDVSAAIETLRLSGIDAISGVRKISNLEIIYLLFNTETFSRVPAEYKGVDMSLENKVKSEAYELLGLDSLTYENMDNGTEYCHYLNLSYAISEFICELFKISQKKLKEYKNIHLSETKRPADSNIQLSLHCHEFSVFYAIARLKKICLPLKTVATYHATLPGRVAGHYAIQKIRNNDSSWSEGVPRNLAELESLSKYADVVTAVGESTRKEVKLFYGVSGILVRNGILIENDGLDWEKKKQCREKIQMFLSDNLYKYHDGEQSSPKKVIPIFSISRIEIENKGYPDLLDSLVLLDRMVKSEILMGKLDEDVRVVCFLVTAHGQKTNLPLGFPINLPKEVLIGEELRLQKMIEERGLECSNLPSGRRCVSAVLYPQWLSDHDEGLNMNHDEFMTGCIAGVFPSRYDPFLLTGLEAGKEYTPSIVSKVCGFSDALKTVKTLVPGMGGVVVVDNVDVSYNETIVDYAIAMDYFLDSYLHDKVKYNLLCEEAYLLAGEMNWELPTKHYYELLTGVKIIKI